MLPNKVQRSKVHFLSTRMVDRIFNSVSFIYFLYCFRNEDLIRVKLNHNSNPQFRCLGLIFKFKQKPDPKKKKKNPVIIPDRKRN